MPAQKALVEQRAQVEQRGLDHGMIDQQRLAVRDRLAARGHREHGWCPALQCYDFFKRFVKPLIARRDGGGTDTSRDFEYGLGRRRHIRPRLPQ